MTTSITVDELNDVRILQEYEEAIGTLLEVRDLENSTMLIFRTFSIVLPSNSIDFEHMIGKRISVLRTDLKDRPYMIKALD